MTTDYGEKPWISSAGAAAPAGSAGAVIFREAALDQLKGLQSPSIICGDGWISSEGPDNIAE